MKFINNIPQFNEKVWIDSHPSKINEKLIEAFAERVCVKCEFIKMPENDLRYPVCMRIGFSFEDIGKSHETFSCASWAKKEG